MILKKAKNLCHVMSDRRFDRRESGSVDLNTFSEIFNVCAVLLHDVCEAHDFCAFLGLIDGFVCSSLFCV